MTEASTIERLNRLVIAPATSRVGKFFEGALVPWLGLRVLWLRPRLWYYAVVPVLLNIAIMVVALLTMFALGTGFFALLIWLLEDWQGSWFYAKLGVLTFALVATFILCVGVAVIMWRLLSTLFCGYFYAQIAKSVEIDLGMKPQEMGEISMWRELGDALKDMGWLLVSLALAILVSLIPVVGAPVALAYSFYFQILTCGRDQLSYPLSLRGKHRQQRAAFCREHFTHTLGLGSVVLAMEFIPIVGALFMVTAAAGAVVLHRRLLQTEH